MFVGMKNHLYVLIAFIGLVFSQSLHASVQQDTTIYSQFEVAPTPWQLPTTGALVAVNARDTSMLDAAMLEVMPEPPGGLQAFMQWVGSNYRFPLEAIDNDVHGTLQMGFIVEADGTITHVEVLKDLGHGTGTEAVRVLKQSPSWKPGILDGKPVRVRFKLPIKLALQGGS